MTSAPSLAWPEANQRHLVAALDRVRRALARHAGVQEPGDLHGPSGAKPPAAPSPSPDGPFALDHLAALFGLSPFERDVVALCAGVELDARFAALCSACSPEPGRAYPTFGVALAALPGAHWSALRPEGPLRSWGLVELDPDGGLTRSRLRLDERVLHHLTGLSSPDARLAALARPVAPGTPPACAAAVAASAARLLADDREPPLILLCASDPAQRRAVAAAASRQAGRGLLALEGSDVPADPAERDALRRRLERENRLEGWVLLLEAEETSGEAWTRRALPFVGSYGGPLVVSCRDGVAVPGRPAIRLDVPRPSAADRVAAWREVLGPAAPQLNGELEAIAHQFELSRPDAQAAARQALAGGGPLGNELWGACLLQGRPRMDSLAQRIEPRAGWDDLVLPPEPMQALRSLAANVRHRVRVMEEWGFAAKATRGLGTAALFCGPSGTGKTMAAEVLANELRLDLYRIDLSQVHDKYLGETEKKLRTVFDAAEGGSAILLFDEADALFGKRTEVRDSHDRYANLEVGYLLQRMEDYRGLAILTTNLRGNIDPAFLRRLRCVVEFPFPDAALRRQLWERAFPAQAPTEGIDLDRLARASLAGGSIRTIALNAAFLAADAGQPIRMQHMAQAARAEYAKHEWPFRDAGFGGAA